MKWIVIAASLVLGCGAAAQDLRGLGEAKLYNRLAGSSVVIESEEGLESGTVIYRGERSALVLTCAHGIPATGEKPPLAVIVERYTAAGNYVEHAYAADVEKIDRAADLALLVVHGKVEALPAPIARNTPRLYERLYSVAAPLGIRGSAASHTLSNLSGEFWSLIGFVIFGSSGSGIMNASGELVCVAARVASVHGAPIAHLGFCIPLGQVRAFVKGYGL